MIYCAWCWCDCVVSRSQFRMLLNIKRQSQVILGMSRGDLSLACVAGQWYPGGPHGWSGWGFMLQSGVGIETMRQPSLGCILFHSYRWWIISEKKSMTFWVCCSLQNDVIKTLCFVSWQIIIMKTYSLLTLHVSWVAEMSTLKCRSSMLPNIFFPISHGLPNQSAPC